MSFEEIKELAAEFGGKIPAMSAGLRRTEGAVTTATGTPSKFKATFQTMLRANTAPTDWITTSVRIADDCDPRIKNAHFLVYEEWKKSIPGNGMEVVDKYRNLFEGIE